MRRDPSPIPGVVLGPYPERDKKRHEPWLVSGAYSFLDGRSWLMRRHQTLLETSARRVIEQLALIEKRSEADLQAGLQHVRAELARNGIETYSAERCLAYVMLAVRNTSGRTMRPNQLMAALAVLQGKLAEVPTGEGKTLATSAAACVAALAGIPVHIVTSNDYLATRDAALQQPLARQLGLSVAAIAPDMSPHARRSAYASDICYCSAKELVFDYLRDRLQPPPSLTRKQPVDPLHGRVLRGLCMAIIDEADSVLIDEAATPFILSESYSEPEQQLACTRALRLAASLSVGFDFRLDARSGHIELTEACQAKINAAPSEDVSPLWAIPRYRVEMVELAVRAMHLLKRDEHYLVRDGAVHIIDNNSGRIASGRAWSRGLHQMVEIKERCKPTPSTRVLAQITFQSFFARYLRLGGMSGTLTEARQELLCSYGLRVLPIPTGRPTGLRILPPRVYVKAEQRWPQVIAEIRQYHAQQLPVLVGTDSVRESERLSHLLNKAGLRHRVLNARQDKEEAAMIAAAGQAGAITVTTNMAGRGTDILIDPAVAHAGGLQVVSCQHNSARRIDRQLFGRAGRLGQPGCAGAILSLEEGLLGRYLSPTMRRLLSAFSSSQGALPIVLAGVLVRLTQYLEERRGAATRRQLREMDANQGTQQLFGARPE